MERTQRCSRQQRQMVRARDKDNPDLAGARPVSAAISRWALQGV